MADIIVGTDTQTGKPVTIDNKDRVRGNYVIGRTGFGKSVFLEQLAAQDAEKGHGFCFLDPAGDVLKHILCRIPQERIDRGDVIFLDPLDYEFPFGLNLYECASNDPATMRKTFNQVEQVFAKIFGMSKDTPRLSMYVRNITSTLLANQGMTMVEIPLLLLDEQFRAKLVDNLLIGSPARLFWKAYDALRPQDRLDNSESTRDRIDGLVNDEILRYIVGQSKTTLNFAEIMNTGKILLVKLPGDDEQITSLLGSVIINQLLLAALSRESIPENKRRQFNIYADEFQRFAIPSFGQLLIEARKYRIATICANQVLNDLGEQLKSRMLNAGCLVVLNVQGEDADKLSYEFNYKPPSAKKPEPVIARNVLEHLNRHKYGEIRSFYGKYVRRWEEAAKQQARERRVRESGRIGDDGLPLPTHVTIYPEMDLGAGVVTYNPDVLKNALHLMNDLFYETQIKGKIDTSMRDELVWVASNVVGGAFNGSVSFAKGRFCRTASQALRNLDP